MAQYDNYNNKGGQYNRSNNNQNYSKSYNSNVEVNLPKITLDYEIQEQLFGDIAKTWSIQLEKESDRTSNKINQIRSFYEKIMELNEKAQNMSDETFKKEVFPFVVMLNSKVTYAKTRNLVSNTFEKMINECVENAVNVKKMNNFKLFFEALIGFYPKK